MRWWSARLRKAGCDIGKKGEGDGSSRMWELIQLYKGQDSFLWFRSVLTVVQIGVERVGRGGERGIAPTRVDSLVIWSTEKSTLWSRDRLFLKKGNQSLSEKQFHCWFLYSKWIYIEVDVQEIGKGYVKCYIIVCSTIKRRRLSNRWLTFNVLFHFTNGRREGIKWGVGWGMGEGLKTV